MYTYLFTAQKSYPDNPWSTTARPNTASTPPANARGDTPSMFNEHGSTGVDSIRKAATAAWRLSTF